jgi:hypothetical protein
LRPITSLAYRLAVFSSLAVLAAGCSTNGTSSVATIPNTMSSPTASQSAYTARQLADNAVKSPARASATTRNGWTSPEIREGNPTLLYWGDFFNNVIWVFEAEGTNPPLKGQITDGVSEPQRLFVDAESNLYATNTGNNTITAYKRESSKPFLTISNGVEGPTGLTVDAEGTVYCANTENQTVTEYPRGQTSPSVTISMPPAANGGVLTPEYLAIDRSDNLYVSYTGGAQLSGVMEFPPGSTTGKDLGIVSGSTNGALALEVDRAGNIIIVDPTSNQIDVFPPGQTTPSEQTAVTAGTPFALSLNRAENVLYATVYNSSSNTFIVQDLDYPNGTMMNYITNVTTDGDEWPIAVSPDTVL